MNLEDSLSSAWEEFKANDDEYGKAACERLNLYLPRADEKPSADFYASLRSFLGYTQQPVELPESWVDKKICERFGLVSYGESGWGISGIFRDERVNAEFVENVFQHKKSVINASSFCLLMPPFIHNLTGYESYSGLSQQLAIEAALRMREGVTGLFCLPTGSGKSLITQSLAYQRNGLTIVVVPTVSLAIDQVESARRSLRHSKDDEIFCYYSGMTDDEEDNLADSLMSQHARLLFTSPESLAGTFFDFLHEKAVDGYLENFVIDEAHMLLEWGASFRPEYQLVKTFRRSLLRICPKLRTYLLSATFDHEETSLLREMFAPDEGCWCEIRCDALRREPLYNVIKCSSHQQKEETIDMLCDLLPRPMIVYVRRPDEADSLAARLSKREYRNVRTFTGKTLGQERQEIIKKWKENRLDFLVATSAFGMGVDKNDIRTVLHAYVPESPNAYYQEVGRGGRDKYHYLAVLCADLGNDKENDLTGEEGAKKYAGKVIQVEYIIGRWSSMYHSARRRESENGTIYGLDTSVVPSYAKNKSRNQLHIDWNIRVLLLLERQHMLTIEGFEPMHLRGCSAYVIWVSIQDDCLLDSDLDEMGRKLTAVREHEKSYHDGQYKKMEAAIKRSGRRCWSDLFTDVYDLVDDCCTGCDRHKSVRQFRPQSLFPLRQAVATDSNFTTCTFNQELFQGCREALVIASRNYWRTAARLLVECKCRGMVLMDKFRPSLNELLLSELWPLLPSDFILFTIDKNELKLMTDGRVDCSGYLSGTFLIVYNNEAPNLSHSIKLTQRILSAVPDWHAIHFLYEDHIAQGTGIPIANFIDGPRYDEDTLPIA